MNFNRKIALYSLVFNVFLVSNISGMAIENQASRNCIIDATWDAGMIHLMIKTYAQRFWSPKRNFDFDWLSQKVKDTNPIYFYDKDKPYYEFTNFYEIPGSVTIDGKKWLTTEQYYQAMKFPKNPALQEKIRNFTSDSWFRRYFLGGHSAARKAFLTADSHQLTGQAKENWRAINLGIMYQGVYEKFSQNSDLQNMLLDTKNHILVEDARENDDFFGAGTDGKGSNFLGLILMIVRCTLQEEKKTVSFEGINVLPSTTPTQQPLGQNAIPQKLEWFHKIKSFLKMPMWLKTLWYRYGGPN